jgi:hypothetical protein
MTVTPPGTAPTQPATKLRVAGYFEGSIDSVPTDEDLVQVLLRLSRPLNRFEQHFVDHQVELGENLLAIAADEDVTLVGLPLDDLTGAIRRVNAILERIQEYGEAELEKHERVTGSARETLKLIKFD